MNSTSIITTQKTGERIKKVLIEKIKFKKVLVKYT